MNFRNYRAEFTDFIAKSVLVSFSIACLFYMCVIFN